VIEMTLTGLWPVPLTRYAPQARRELLSANTFGDMTRHRIGQRWELDKFSEVIKL
jgi:hypothetical protein